jgi:hypothetical protein
MVDDDDVKTEGEELTLNPTGVEDTNAALFGTVGLLGEVQSGFASTNEAISSLSGLSPSLDKTLSGSGKAIKNTFSGVTAEIKNASRMNNVFDGVRKSIGSMSGASEAMKNVLTKSINSVQNDVAGLDGAIGAIGEITSAYAGKKIMEAMDKGFSGSLTLAKQLTDMQRSVASLGMSFGKTYENADAGAKLYMDRHAQIIGSLNATEEQLKAVAGAFKDTLSVDDQIANISELSNVQAKFGEQLTATSAVITIGSAKGMDNAEVASIISQSYTEFGETLGSAIKSFGDIEAAAEGSGLGFGKVAKSIQESTNTLKMFGGTIGSVAPMFRAFTKSLDEGKKGLAPELLKKYTDGLAAMKLEQRALIGIQAGMGAGGVGAIGAGLKMEAALETGEGMGEVSEGLISTLKQFGGGEVVTREQALENPALERNFIVQRKLLQQMLGVDTAQANETLKMLQGIDSSGIKGATDQEERLSDILTSGRDNQKQNTSDLDKAANLFKEAEITSSDKIVEAIKNLGDNLGVSDILRSVRAGLKESIESGGDIKKGVGKFKEVHGARTYDKVEKTGSATLEEKRSKPMDFSKANKNLLGDVLFEVGSETAEKTSTETILPEPAPAEKLELPKPEPAEKLELPKPEPAEKGKLPEPEPTKTQEPLAIRLSKMISDNKKELKEHYDEIQKRISRDKKQKELPVSLGGVSAKEKPAEGRVVEEAVKKEVSVAPTTEKGETVADKISKTTEANKKEIVEVGDKAPKGIEIKPLETLPIPAPKTIKPPVITTTERPGIAESTIKEAAERKMSRAEVEKEAPSVSPTLVAKPTNMPTTTKPAAVAEGEKKTYDAAGLDKIIKGGMASYLGQNKERVSNLAKSSGISPDVLKAEYKAREKIKEHNIPQPSASVAESVAATKQARKETAVASNTPEQQKVAPEYKVIITPVVNNGKLDISAEVKKENRNQHANA